VEGKRRKNMELWGLRLLKEAANEKINRESSIRLEHCVYSSVPLSIGLI
jgi:hypothetical protein